MENLTLDTELTLREFIDLFNDENENYLWDMFYLKLYKNGRDISYDISNTWDEAKIVPRNRVEISDR